MGTLRVILAWLLLAAPCWIQSDGESSTTTTTQETKEFRQLLEKLAPQPAGPCEPPVNPNADIRAIESSLFQRATSLLLSELNAAGNAQVQPHQRATAALKALERLSTDVNSAWPDENRFHFQVLNLTPVLVTKLTIRGHQAFVVLGVPRDASGQPGHMWQEVGSDDEAGEHDWPPSSIDLYPLKRGPSGHARFLARLIYSGCAGSYGVAYDAREWDANESLGLYQVIKQEGSFGLDDAPAGNRHSPEHPFAPVGALHTQGALINLPFCWFSAIDTWDNPSMCAVDTYDVSGDQIRFLSRAFNRPDLLPVANAIEYAEHRDYPAVLAYCASAKVAWKLVREIPPDVFAGDLRVTRISERKERVQLGFPNSYRFEVEKQDGRWLIFAFSEE
jgi:hypothetical protein